MKVDSTFEFEKRRNIPVRYDRELVGATIQAMKRVQEIQKAREDRYYERRMKGVKAAEKAAHAVEIAQNIELVKPVMSRSTLEVNAKEKVRSKEKKSKMEME